MWLQRQKFWKIIHLRAQAIHLPSVCDDSTLFSHALSDSITLGCDLLVPSYTSVEIHLFLIALE
jgi:hypothetical protein